MDLFQDFVESPGYKTVFKVHTTTNQPRKNQRKQQNRKQSLIAPRRPRTLKDKNVGTHSNFTILEK